MNRHDVLYNRGREVLNCRVQRVWYRLNPYLERSYRIEDGSKFDVPSSKFVEPLQSVVLCENYFEDKPADWQEVSIESFWDFLYSDCWSRSYSLRVLDGQLLDWILTTMNNWEKDKKIVCHETFVFARNKREIRSCYKTDKTDQVYGHFEEILFVDFKYFGRNLRPQNTTQTDRGSTIIPLSSVSFTLPGDTSEELLSGVQGDETESTGDKTRQSQSESAKLMKKIHGFALFNDNFLPRIVPRFSPNVKHISRETSSVKDANASSSTTLSSSSSSNDGQRSLAYSDPIYIETDDLFNEGPIEEDEKSIHALGEEFYLSEKFEKLPTMPSSSSEYLKRRKSELEIERKRKKFELSIKNTVKRTFKPQQLPVDMQDDGDKAPLIKLLKGVPTFDEFLRLLEEDNRYDPRFKKLKQKKKKIKKKYKLDKKTSSVVKLEGSDVQLQTSSRVNLINTNQGRDLANEFQKRRLSRIPSNVSTASDGTRSHKRRDSAPPSAPTSLRQRKFAEEVVGVTECEPFREPLMRAETVSSPGVKNADAADVGGRIHDGLSSILPKIASESPYQYPGIPSPSARPTFQRRPLSSIGENHLEIEPLMPRPSRLIRTPNLLITTASGENLACEITDTSYFKTPVSSHMSGPTEVINPHPPEYFFDSRKTADTPSDEVDQLDTTEEVAETYTAPKTQSNSRSSFSLGRRSTRRRSSIIEESPDVYSDDEEEIPMHGVSTCFNTLKLNTWYSIEKLRGKDFYKKKPAFMEVLEKYRQLHRAVQAFKKPEKKGGTEGSKPVVGMLRRLTLMIKEGRTLEEILRQPTEEKIIGKLKQYDFLKRKSPTIDCSRYNQRPIEFSTFSLSDFQDKLMKALDDFVVRQEHVVSSQNFQSVTTITFTRPEVFRKYKM